MGFTKVRMGKEEIFTTIVEDLDGRELERWKVMKRDFPDVVSILSKKFGLNLKVIKKDKDRDLDWALR